jgi:nucleoside-diphosphate-sugar epimerase
MLTVLATGLTGNTGKTIARYLRGRVDQVIALMRPERHPVTGVVTASVYERAQKLFVGLPIYPIEDNALEPRFGLTDAVIGKLFENSIISSSREDEVVVLHNASQTDFYGEETRRVNTEGINNLLDAVEYLKKCGVNVTHFVLISTACVTESVGASEDFLPEDAKLHYPGDYVFSKHQQEIDAQRRCAELGISLAVMRWGIVASEAFREPSGYLKFFQALYARVVIPLRNRIGLTEASVPGSVQIPDELVSAGVSINWDVRAIDGVPLLRVPLRFRCGTGDRARLNLMFDDVCEKAAVEATVRKTSGVFNFYADDPPPLVDIIERSCRLIGMEVPLENIGNVDSRPTSVPVVLQPFQGVCAFVTSAEAFGPYVADDQPRLVTRRTNSWLSRNGIEPPSSAADECIKRVLRHMMWYVRRKLEAAKQLSVARSV